MFERISPPSFTTAAEVSSQEVSMPRIFTTRTVGRLSETAPHVGRLFRCFVVDRFGLRGLGSHGMGVVLREFGLLGKELDAPDDIDGAFKLNVGSGWRLFHGF